MKYLFGLLLLLCLGAIRMDAQLLNPGLDPFGNPLPLDTSSNEADTIINKNGFFSIFKGKPGKAALYGLLIPSGGQIYNKKWWKVPLALGIDGALIYVVVDNKRNYKEAQDLLTNTLKADPTSPLISRIREQRNYFRKWSEYSWIWLFGGHLFTVIDAYVDRQLMDFDVSPDLSLETNPFMGNTLVFQTHFKISLNAKNNGKSPIDFSQINWNRDEKNQKETE